jgi:4-hydroxy-tetrahydrodipicolinate synthase
MSSARFGRVLTAMVTPFNDDGSLDVEGAAQLAEWLVGHGSDGLVLAGTTGEAPTLSDAETVDLWQTVRKAVPDAPLVAGTGSNDTRHTVELSEQAAACGVDGLLVVVPYYNRPPQAGIEAHMRAVAAATDLPMLMYDVPGRTGRAMTNDTIVRLANEVPNIVGLKEARGNPGDTAQVVAEAVGAVGVIGVATHWSGTQHGEMIAAYLRGDVGRAREINARLLDSFAYETTSTWQHATGVKALLHELGLPSGPCRLPLPPVMPDDARLWAREIIATLGISR